MAPSRCFNPLRLASAHVLCVLAVAWLCVAGAAQAPAAPVPASAVVKLDKKLAHKQEKHTQYELKLEAAQALQAEGEAELAAALALPESTPAEQKAKAKALKAAQFQLGKAAKKIVLWNAALAGNEEKQAVLTTAILQLNPAWFSVPQLSASPGEGSVVLEWPAVPQADSYLLAWDDVPGVSVQSDAWGEVSGSPYVVGELAGGFTVFARVAAIINGSCSQPSDEVSVVAGEPGGGAGRAAWDPPWATVEPLQTLTIAHDPLLSDQENGAALKAAIAVLDPGDRLEVGGGTWSVNSYFNVSLQGSAQAPIWIVAQAGEVPVITRPDASQNVMNVGGSAATRYVCFRGLQFTGGSAGIRLYNCANVWLDQCEIHHVGEAALTANTNDTEALFITRNHIHHTTGTGEGMYLGANNGAVVMRDSVVAVNHVHDCGGVQGDGIELKQGSYGNWIVGNYVHDTHYPCIIAYGTGGNPVNVIERNVCVGSGDNVMQVQGEALVRNNLLMAGGAGFHSHDHQGTTQDLQFVHNTVVTAGKGCNLSSWNNRPGMVFANNAVYSQNTTAVQFSGGSTGVTIAGNVAYGGVSGAPGNGFVSGTGLADFIAAAWNGSAIDVTPAPGSPLLGAAAPAWSVGEDIAGDAVTLPLESGCVDAP